MNGRRWSATALLAVLAVAASANDAVASALQLDRARSAEVWRMVTGHLTHWSASHLCWDLAVFAALGWFVEVRSRRVFWVAVGGSAVAIPCVVALLDPVAATYRGLSGIDSALFGAAIVMLIREVSGKVARVACAALAAGLMAKLGYEVVTGEALFVTTGGVFRSLPLAHAVGAAVGVLGAARYPWSARSGNRPRATVTASRAFRA